MLEVVHPATYMLLVVEDAATPIAQLIDIECLDDLSVLFGRVEDLTFHGIWRAKNITKLQLVHGKLDTVELPARAFTAFPGLVCLSVQGIEIGSILASPLPTLKELKVWDIATLLKASSIIRTSPAHFPALSVIRAMIDEDLSRGVMNKQLSAVALKLQPLGIDLVGPDGLVLHQVIASEGI